MGNRQLILSMGADDLRNKDAFFNGLAHLLRQKGYPNGSSAFSVGDLVWTFFEGVVNQSSVVFELVMTSRSVYSYRCNLGGVQRSGSISDLKDIKGVLP